MIKLSGRLCCGLFFIFFLGFAPISLALTLYQQLDSRSISPSMALWPLIKGQPVNAHAGRFAFTQNHFELGAKWQHWQLAYVQDYHYILRFNSVAARLYQQDNQHQTLDSGGKQALYFEAWHLRSQGIQLAYQWQINAQWSITPMLSVLQGMSFQDGSLKGWVDVLGAQQLGLVALDYRYSQDKLLADPAQSHDAAGYALSLAWNWQNPRWHWQGRINNLASALYWRAAPSTAGDFDSNRQIPGSLAVRSLFSGHREQQHYRQRLPVEVSSSMAYQIAHWQLSSQADYYLSRLWLRPGIRYTAWPVAPYLAYEIRDKQWLLGFSSRYINILIGSDRWPLKNAHAFTLQLQLQQTF